MSSQNHNELMEKYQECLKLFVDVTSNLFDSQNIDSIHAGMFNRGNGKYYKVDVSESSEEELQKTVEELRHER